MEAGVARERQLDGRPAEGPSDGLLVRVPDDEPQQGARGLFGGGVGAVGADQVPAHLGDLAEGRRHLLPHQRGLGVDVEAGQHEGDLVAEAAEAVEADLEGGGGGSPRTPSTRTRSGPSWVSLIVSRRAVTSGPAYRAPDVS